MRKTKVGNMEIIIDPEPEMMIINKDVNMVHTEMEEYKVVVDGKEMIIHGWGGETDKTYTFSTEKARVKPFNPEYMMDMYSTEGPGRARKIYNRLRRFLK